MAGPPFKVKAIYEYTSEHDDDLTFPMGQIITVTELEGDEWYVGEYTDVTGAKHEGLFPTNFVEKYEPEVPARPTRPAKQKQEPVPAPPAPAIAPASTEPEDLDEDPTPPPSAPKSLLQPTEPRTRRSLEQQQPTSPRPAAPPPAPKPAPAEPADPAPAPASAAKKAPPPIAAKSNAFKDRIAAFNQPAAAPIAPFQPGRQQQAPSNTFIKKPFVAPPPSKNAYVPPPKAEPVVKPYVRDEDPEIREREEEDRAAAEAAGLGLEPSPAAVVVVGGQDEDDEPKPMTLKERMALLQQQQQEQAQRRAEAASRKKPPPQKKASGSSDMGAGAGVEDYEALGSEGLERQSLDQPRVPSVQRRLPPEPMSPGPPVPDHEILSDGHEADQSGAGDLTEEDDAGTLGPDSDDRAVEGRRSVDEEDAAGPEEEEEEEVDEETRRKEELRARMARLGGGMPGMGAPFNPFGAPPQAPLRKRQSTRERDVADEAPSSAPQIPQMIPVPGMPNVHSPPPSTTQRLSHVEQQDDDDEEDEEDVPPLPPPPKRSSTVERSAPPPVPKESRPMPPPPQDRSAPPPPPGATSRPVPPPPPGAIRSPGPGSESDDEMSSAAKRSSTEVSGGETPMPIRTSAPAVASPRDVPPRPDDKRSSYFSGNEATSEKRSSRVPPPVPGSEPVMSPRPPPPPPPAQLVTPGRQSTAQELDQDEHVGSDYDGDYDTDIASSAKHKDALKAPHYRDASLTESPLLDDTPVSSPPPPPPPHAAAPRAVPPPPPPSVPKTRQSMDRPPPPVPPPREGDPEDEDYDPYRYTESPRPVPPPPSSVPGVAPPPPPQRALPPEPFESSADDSQAALSPPRRSTDRVSTAMSQAMGSAQPTTRGASADIQRSASTVRRSVEQPRPSSELGQIAADIPLNEETPWWTAARPLPPVLQDRNGVDILSECEETAKSKRGGRKEITKDIYILYMDYSQTVISVRYDSQDASEAQLEQRHEAPPLRLRQDQLEAAWQQFGSKIADAATALGQSKRDASVGDIGSPYSLPLELIKAQPNALLPVGTRAYGALVYANLANASTMQFDEIRRGDIITVRNAKFEGHHGAMKTKYKSDYGPSHVAVVEEWDGTRRAVRAWEQGRERKGGVRSEKFRLGDLRSGEVRVWRVVGRDWVGWES